MRVLKIAAFALALTIPAFAFDAGVNEVGSSDPLAPMTITSETQIAAKRAALFSTIFGPNGIPTNPTVFDGNCCDGSPTTYFDAPGLYSTYWHGWEMKPAPGMLIARTLLTKFTGSTCLLIVNGGHGQGYFSSNPPVDTKYPSVDTLVRQLDGTCDVILSSMPFQGENEFARGYVPVSPTDPHGWLGAQPVTDGGTPLKYFLIPAMAAMNKAIAERASAGLPAYQKIIALGHSGGGLTSTLMAALDTRITHSFSVAGGVPLEWRVGGDVGDWEQQNIGIGYLDLFALSTGSGRVSYLMFNGLDACCFKANTVYPWAGPLKERLDTFPGEFGILVDIWGAAHEIGPKLRNAIMDLIG